MTTYELRVRVESAYIEETWYIDLPEGADVHELLGNPGYDDYIGLNEVIEAGTILDVATHVEDETDRHFLSVAEVDDPGTEAPVAQPQAPQQSIFTMDANAIRYEVEDGFEGGYYIQEELDFINSLSDDVIVDAVDRVADSGLFWQLYDQIRSDVIQTLLAQMPTTKENA